MPDDDGLPAFVAKLDEAIKSRDRKAFAQLHFDLNSIEYLTTVDRSGISIEAPKPVSRDIRCEAPCCGATWRTPDACLLLINDKWYCRAHHPPVPAGFGNYVGFTKQVGPVTWTEPSAKE